jgi:hypothetical protein
VGRGLVGGARRSMTSTMSILTLLSVMSNVPLISFASLELLFCSSLVISLFMSLVAHTPNRYELIS